MTDQITFNRPYLTLTGDQAQAIMQGQIPSGALRVFVALYHHAGRHWTCWPSNDRLGAMSGLKRRRVQQCLTWLEEAGWIARRDDPSGPSGSVNRVFSLRNFPTGGCTPVARGGAAEHHPERTAKERTSSSANVGLTTTPPPVPAEGEGGGVIDGGTRAHEAQASPPRADPTPPWAPAPADAIERAVGLERARIEMRIEAGQQQPVRNWTSYLGRLRADLQADPARVRAILLEHDRHPAQDAKTQTLARTDSMILQLEQCIREEIALRDKPPAIPEGASRRERDALTHNPARLEHLMSELTKRRVRRAEVA